jgi:hypothetical protein
VATVLKRRLKFDERGDIAMINVKTHLNPFCSFENCLGMRNPARAATNSNAVVQI